MWNSLTTNKNNLPYFSIANSKIDEDFTKRDVCLSIVFQLTSLACNKEVLRGTFCGKT